MEAVLNKSNQSHRLPKSQNPMAQEQTKQLPQSYDDDLNKSGSVKPVNSESLFELSA